MKSNFKFILMTLAALSAVGTANASDVCLSCELSGLPSSKPFMELERLAKNEKIKTVANPGLKVRSISSEVDEDPKRDAFYEKYCLTFQTSEAGELSTVIKDMENSPYPIDDYFRHTKCQPDRYSAKVKSPMIQYVAEVPSAREKFLDTIWKYYSIKRKQPEIFTEILNVKNTKGETILDFIESLTLQGEYGPPDSETNQGPIKRMIKMICDHGGVYSTHKNKACPTK